jgi:hypothetical protein
MAAASIILQLGRIDGMQAWFTSCAVAAIKL